MTVYQVLEAVALSTKCKVTANLGYAKGKTIYARFEAVMQINQMSPLSTPQRCDQINRVN